MSQLISLNIYKRDGKLTTGLYGFDVDDIVSPIRLNAEGRSYFSARMLKGTSNGGGYNNGKIEYEVTDLLADIEEQSDKLIMLTVLYRRSFAMNSEVFVFNSSHISENIKPTPAGSQFFYQEDGDPEPVEYVVLESVADIVAQAEIVGGISGKVVNYSALPPANLHADEVWICLESQGTKWLPGSLGGTYYPHGQYYSTGTDWLYDATPYQATQANVNAGIITDQFVSPNTFVNASKWGSYVPYTGATADVNLGVYGIQASKMSIGAALTGGYNGTDGLYNGRASASGINRIFVGEVASSATSVATIELRGGGTTGATNPMGRINVASYGGANFTGTSLASGSAFYFDASGTGYTGSASGKLAFLADSIYGIIGSTSTNKGFRMDVNGFRIAAISALHTSNTERFRVEGINASHNMYYDGISLSSITTGGVAFVGAVNGTSGSPVASFFKASNGDNTAVFKVNRGSGTSLNANDQCVISFGLPNGASVFAAIEDSADVRAAWEVDATTTASTQYSYISFRTKTAGTLAEKFRVSSYGVRIASVATPASPVDGDIWFDGTDIKMRVGGVTKTFTLV